MPIDLRIKTFDKYQISIGFHSSQETDIYIYDAKSFFKELTKKCNEFLLFMKRIFGNNIDDFDYLITKNKELKELVNNRYMQI
jgi:hypothetical protein